MGMEPETSRIPAQDSPPGQRRSLARAAQLSRGAELKHRAPGDRSAVPLVETSAELSLRLPTTENWDGENKKQKYTPSGNSVYQFKLNISLLKSEVQPQNAALVKLLTYKMKAHAIF